MTTVIDYSTLKENDHLHYVLCYMVELLWEGVDVLEYNDFDEKKFAEDPNVQKINIKRGYLWDWLCHYYPDQEITIKDNIRYATFDTKSLSILLSGVPFEKVDVNKPLEDWVSNF